MKPRVIWTFENIVRIAHMYPTRTMFAMGHPRGYRAASKAGMLDYLFPKRVAKEKMPLVPTLEQLQSIRPSVPLNPPKQPIIARTLAKPIPLHGDRRAEIEEEHRRVTLDDKDRRYIEREVAQFFEDYESTALQAELDAAARAWGKESADHVNYFRAVVQKTLDK